MIGAALLKLNIHSIFETTLFLNQAHTSLHAHLVYFYTPFTLSRVTQNGYKPRSLNSTLPLTTWVQSTRDYARHIIMKTKCVLYRVIRFIKLALIETILKLESKLLKATRRTTQTNNSKSPYVFIGRRLAGNCQFTVRAKHNCMEYIYRRAPSKVGK